MDLVFFVVFTFVSLSFSGVAGSVVSIVIVSKKKKLYPQTFKISVSFLNV